MLTESIGDEYTLGLGYRLKDVRFRTNFGGKKITLKGDLNIKADFSYRNNITVLRNLEYDNNQVTAGLKLMSIKITADYAISKNITSLFFYDHNLTQVSQRLILLIPLIYYYPELSTDHRFSKLFSIYFFGTLIYFSFGFFGLFVTRINMFFRILEILLIPLLYNKIKNNNQKIIVQFCIMIWCFTIMTWLYYKDAYYPFKTIFGNFY